MSAGDFIPVGGAAVAEAPIKGEIVTDPKRIEQIRAEHKVDLDPFVDAAMSITVETAEDAEGATEVLTEIARRKKALESERKKLARPVDDAKKAIQNLFNGLKAPLDEAREILEPKVIAFQEAEDRRIAKENAERERENIERMKAEQARIDAERAEAKRLADEAAAAAREASERMASEQSAQAEVEALAAAERARQAEQELAIKREEQPAFELAEREEAITTVQTARGSATRRKVWTFEVTDPSSVPRQFLTVDEKAIRAAVKDGEREIPGVRIFEESSLAVRG